MISANPYKAAIYVIVYTVLCATSATGSANAQDDGHARWHHYYQTWKQPGTDLSCCNARVIYPGGVEVGDCEPTRFDMRDGDWYAWERHTAQWLKVPDNKLIRERNPSGEEGHLCWTPFAGIICAVPPDTGG